MGGQAVLAIDQLPSEALAAAAVFHSHWAGQVRQHSDGGTAVAVVLPPAPADHADWRRAAARDLARALAPARVNLIAGDAGEALNATLGYLGDAPGVTGHYLTLYDD